MKLGTQVDIRMASFSGNKCLSLPPPPKKKGSVHFLVQAINLLLITTVSLVRIETDFCSMVYSLLLFFSQRVPSGVQSGTMFGQMRCVGLSCRCAIKLWYSQLYGCVYGYQ